MGWGVCAVAFDFEKLFALKAEDDSPFRELDGAQAPAMSRVGVQEATAFPSVDLWKPPGPVAGAFFMSDADVIGIRGPVGSGKTTAHLRSRIRRAKMMPLCADGRRRYKVCIVRETYRQLWATTIPSWWSVMPKSLGRWAGGRGDPVTHAITFEDQWGPIDFIAEFLAFGSSPGEIDANIRGIQTTDLGMEEADTNPVAGFTGGMTRIDRWPSKSDHFHHLPQSMWSYGQVSCSYNAPDEDNWTVRVLEGENQDAEAKQVRQSLADEGIDIKFFRQPGFNEPGCENLANLGPKYYPRAIAAMRAEGRGNSVERLIYNQIGFIRVGDPVFRGHFRRNLHVSPTPLAPIPGVPLRIGLDQGYFGAAVIGQFVRPFQWRILAELSFKDGCFAPEFGRALRDLLNTRFPGHTIYSPAFCDMAGNASESLEDVTWMNTVSEHARLEIEPQRLGGNRIEPRLAVWRAAMDWEQFGVPGLIIDPSCKVLIRGLENDYVWEQDVDKAENRGRKPKKKGVRAADVIDAGGYMMLAESLPDGRPLTSQLTEDGQRGMEATPADGWAPAGQTMGSYDFNPMEGF
jgi:hypothetical protein